MSPDCCMYTLPLLYPNTYTLQYNISPDCYTLPLLYPNMCTLHYNMSPDCCTYTLPLLYPSTTTVQYEPWLLYVYSSIVVPKHKHTRVWALTGNSVILKAGQRKGSGPVFQFLMVLSNVELARPATLPGGEREKGRKGWKWKVGNKRGREGEGRDRGLEGGWEGERMRGREDETKREMRNMVIW